MEQFSNAAFWGRHPMPYFKIPRTEKYGMQCARAGPTDIEGSITIRGPRGPKDGEKELP